MLLAAGFPLWPGTHLLSRPGDPKLPKGPHVDAKLNADTHSAWQGLQQGIPTVSSSLTKPPSSWITGSCHRPRREEACIARYYDAKFYMSALFFLIASFLCRLLLLLQYIFTIEILLIFFTSYFWINQERPYYDLNTLKAHWIRGALLYQNLFNCFNSTLH